MTPPNLAPLQNLYPGLGQAAYHGTIDTILKLIQSLKDFVNCPHPIMPPSATGPTQLYSGLGRATYHVTMVHGIDTLPWS